MPGRPYSATEFPRRMAIMIALLACVLLFGAVAFSLMKGIPLGDGFLRTVESLGFMYEEQTPGGRALEALLTIVGLFIVWWILWTIADMLREGGLGEYLKAKKFLNRMKGMKNHYIIAGGGRFGEEVAKNLVKYGKEYIILDRDEQTVAKLKKKGLFAAQGDAHDEAVLRQAGIDSAKAVIITIPDTEKALVATMLAKELNEKIDVYARCENPSFVNRLKKAGAKSVIVPEMVAADKLIDEID